MSASDASMPDGSPRLRFGRRSFGGRLRWVVLGLAIAWALFQLLLPCVVILSSDIVRAVHLAFALALVYLAFPGDPGDRKAAAAGTDTVAQGTGWVDPLLALLAAFAALYYALDYEGIAGRIGQPAFRDIAVGVLLLALLLEGTRRAVGPALPCVALTFVLLCFLGPELPSFLAFKRVSLNQLLGQLTMSTEGIYGVPLYVSASVVYLFVLLGAILEKSGGGQYFVQLAFCLLGKYRGGPAKAAVVASGMTGMVSGSSIANTVTTGTFTIPMMKKCGYPPEKAAAVEVAASTNGQLMPPIMGAAAFIIAERCRIPYLAVVRAAFVPAVVSYLALLYITHLEACKLGLKGLPPEDVPRFRDVLPRGLHFFLPLAVLVTLLLLRFSPEYAAFWTILGLAALIIVRDQWQARRQGTDHVQALRASVRLLRDSLVTGSRNMIGIGVAVASAGIVVGVMTLGPGSLITEVVARLAGGNLALMLLLAAVISLLLGMGLPTTANYIVVSTLVAGTILELGQGAGLVIPLIAAHLFCFFFGILADDTPPVGLAAYAASAIAESDPIPTGVQGFLYDLRTAILPFMFLLNTELLLIGVGSVWHGAFVFATALAAMCAFAAATQGYFLRRNRWYESVLLGLVALLLLQPHRTAAWTRLPGWAPYIGAVVVGLLVAALQRRKAGTADDETPGPTATEAAGELPRERGTLTGKDNTVVSPRR